ncbi:DNA circularization N-terminal domain-containing protein [Neisseria sp. Dent CA1/247]|uniref:DNA circularization protein n=1 Tax=Neisseria sp. Dent CA1/247 TaxID=2912675 RepID=UPI001FD05756|nr:DNA circularization N-terminal domain-containing protein [Neisseria sp. Dent CA1/247]UOO76039.1 DNA circularization N-terminal domain-containing protein [Neisseria sp. Dent CA1/247]
MALREASFKGAKFHVEETGGRFGRRTVLHQYPFRDVPYGEDLGRAARRFDITAFFIDAAEYQAFVDACESEGAGTLIHPFYGKAFVQLEDTADVRFPRAEGGRYSVQVSFVEAGENTEPDAQEDAGGLLDSAVDDALDLVGQEFAVQWLKEVAGFLDVAEIRLNQVYQFIEGFLDADDLSKSQLSRLTTGSLVAKPLELFARIKSLIRMAIFKAKPFSIRNETGYTIAAYPAFQTASRPQTNLLTTLRGGAVRADWAVNTIEADLQALPPSLADMVRQTAVLEQVRQLAFAEYDGKADLIKDRARALAALEAEITIAPSAVFRVLETARTHAVAAVEARIPTLREMKVLETKTTMPALVLAWQVNGSIEAYADIVSRNKVRHPGFVPPGRVEVMRDGQ